MLIIVHLVNALCWGIYVVVSIIYAPCRMRNAWNSFQEVNEMWSGLGYYSRGRRLHEGACLVSPVSHRSLFLYSFTSVPSGCEGFQWADAQISTKPWKKSAWCGSLYSRSYCLHSSGWSECPFLLHLLYFCWGSISIVCCLFIGDRIGGW